MTEKLSDEQIEKLSFEQALTRLEQIIAEMEKGGLNLEGSIASYDIGIKLKKHCEKKLKEATLKVEKILVDNDGVVKTQDF
ncbi:MAG: exodeoxyribonuclease VII small subunit [Alphaproteobacteria bacterium]|jgi:exodeoxyribonuclease VII small subunit